MRFTYIAMFGLALGLGSQGFGAHIKVSPKARWNVFKGHDRVPLDTSKLPQVGRLMFRIGSHGLASCTGTLIGKKLVLSAAHCFEPTVSYNAQVVEYNRKVEAYNADLSDDDDPKPLAKPRHVYFLPSFADGELPAGAKPVPSVIGEGWMGNWSEDIAHNPQDWSIIKLESAPTSTHLQDFGTLPVSSKGVFPGMSLVAVGYSGDYQDGNTAGVDYHCHVRKVLSQGSFFHDCAIEQGASGGPLLAMSVDGTTITQDNEAEYKDVEPSRVQYSIVGVITAEIKRRAPRGWGGFFGKNMPFFGSILGGDEKSEVVGDAEYSDHTPNIGNSSVNFVDAVREALSQEGSPHALTPSVPNRHHDTVVPGDNNDDVSPGDDEGDDSEPYSFDLTHGK